MSKSQDTSPSDIPFPWELGIHDAHCHPTDTMSSIDDIPNMRAQTLTIMATRGEDQELVAEVAERFGSSIDSGASTSASMQKRVIPCFGWHPWFSHQVFDDSENTGNDTKVVDKKTHYQSVLSPSLKDEDKTLLNALPEPRPLSNLISETKARLQEHPDALVGEIGIDRAFRIPNAWKDEDVDSRDRSLTPGSREGRTLSPYRVQSNHQKAIFKAQLKLAGELQRPVSVHSVQVHGVIMEILRSLWAGYEKKPLSKRQKRRGSVHQAHDASDDERNKETKKTLFSPLPFPPRICMHSYSGPPEALSQFLHPWNPADVYFSFSAVINFTNDSAKKVKDVIRALPDDRILVESDLHCAGERMDEMLEQIVRQVCEIRGWKIEEGIRRLGDNYKRFIYG